MQSLFKISISSSASWYIYFHTLTKWINSCETTEELYKTFPFIMKYCFRGKVQSMRDIISGTQLYRLFLKKHELLIHEDTLNKFEEVIDKGKELVEEYKNLISEYERREF